MRADRSARPAHAVRAEGHDDLGHDGERGTEHLALDLVADDNVGQGEQLLGQRLRGGGVEHRRDPMLAGRGEGRLDDAERNLQLREHDRGTVEHPSRHRVADVLHADLPVCPGHHDDRVLPARGDRDERHARRIVTAGAHLRQVDTLRCEMRPLLLTEVVAADPGDQHRLGPGPRRCDRLIGALAAGQRLEARPEHRLAGGREMGRPRDEIDVDAPDDDHPPHGRHATRPDDRRHVVAAHELRDGTADGDRRRSCRKGATTCMPTGRPPTVRPTGTDVDGRYTEPISAGHTRAAGTGDRRRRSGCDGRASAATGRARWPW